MNTDLIEVDHLDIYRSIVRGGRLGVVLGGRLRSGLNRREDLQQF